MAKNSRYDTARLATTVNGRYSGNSNLREGFFLDGRLPGKRDQFRADVTTDREDKGFLFALFGTRDEEWSDSDAAPAAFNNLLEAVKNGNQDIDAEINDLADCAMAVTGRATLSNDKSKTPYFAGVLVKEKETAAVVTGNAIVMLYRDDMLYPLNDSSYTFSDTDYNGNRVAGINDYIAGLAGSIKYSNIAELQQNDCIILTTTEVVEAVGQQEMLRLLHEAEDQADAADMIVEAVSDKLPESSVQILISFVEYIVPASKTGKLNLNVFNSTSDEPGEKTTLYQPINSQAINEYRQSNEAKDAEERHIGNYNETEISREAEEVNSVDDQGLGDQAEEYRKDLLGNDSEVSRVTPEDKSNEAEGKDDFAPAEKFSAAAAASAAAHGDFAEDEQLQSDSDGYEEASDEYTDYYDDYDQDYYDDVEYNDEYADHHDAYGEYVDDYYDDYEPKTYTGEEYDDPDYDPYAIDEGAANSNIKRYILYAVLALVCVLCILALYRMLSSSGKTQQTTTVHTTTLPFIQPEKQTTAGTTTKATLETTKKPTTTTNNQGNNAEKPNNGNAQGGNQEQNQPAEHGNNGNVTPQPGNSVGYEVTVSGNENVYLYDLAIQYYDHVDDETIRLIKEANGLEDNVLAPGTTIYLP